MDNQHRKIAGYRELDAAALQIIAEQKAIEKLLCEHCAELGRIAQSPSQKRWLALARTHLETGMMFAIKTVAAPTVSVGQIGLEPASTVSVGQLLTETPSMTAAEAILRAADPAHAEPAP